MKVFGVAWLSLALLSADQHGGCWSGGDPLIEAAPQGSNSLRKNTRRGAGDTVAGTVASENAVPTAGTWASADLDVSERTEVGS